MMSGRGRRRRTPARRAEPRQGGARDPAVPDASEPLYPGSAQDADEWAETRHGAIAGRGFHFQDAVGALLAAQIASGAIPDTSVVPEGREDMWLDGSVSQLVQAKSRRPDLGAFPASAAAGHVVDAWNRQAARLRDGSRLVFVLETGIEGEDGLDDMERPLGVALDGDSAFLSALRSRATNAGFNANEVNSFVQSTSVVAITLGEITSEALFHLSECVDLPAAPLEMVLCRLRNLVADAVDANANPDYSQRRTLDRSELVAHIQNAAQLIDVDALEAALSSGCCETFAYDASAVADDRFFEGVSVQPFHVAAGLVTPRPDAVGEVVAGLGAYSVVVIHGPSGVGKSAVLWTLPRELSHVLWFRVHRLSATDVSDLVTLARAYRASAESPVGFLVDAAGTENFDGWSQLRARTAALPGVLLVATARNEDLITIPALADCAQVDVRLNETTAAAIFEGLSRRGTTEFGGWREAYEQCDGLTLEFTHLLTRGERLAAVIGDQVDQRIRERRNDELGVLRAVSVADRWSVSLPVPDLVRTCGLSEADISTALARLEEEHLVIEREGVVSGMHQLRSTAICEAVHAHPPPDLRQTVERVVPSVPTSQLHGFVASLLRDEPELIQVLIEVAQREELSADRMAAFLHGVRLADYRARVAEWRELVEQRGVPPSTWMVLFSFTTAGLTMPDAFPAPLRSAQRAMETLPGPQQRDEFISAVGPDRIAQLVVATEDLRSAANLLAVCAQTAVPVDEAICRALDASSPVVDALRASPVEALAAFLTTAHEAAPAFAGELIELLGGRETMLQQLRVADPWIVELGLDETTEAAIARCRFLHLSDTEQEDPDEAAHAISRRLWSLVPGIDGVDVQAALPGGGPLRVGDFEHGVSRLLREAHLSEHATAWNRARVQVIRTQLGVNDSHRLRTLLPLLEEAALLAHQVGTQLVKCLPGLPDLSGLRHRIESLHAAGTHIKPSTRGAGLGEPGILDRPDALENDDPVALVTDLSGNIVPRITQPDHYRRLVAFIRESVVERHLEGCKNEPWPLVGVNGHPGCLDQMRETLLDIAAVLEALARGESEPAEIRSSALSGSQNETLRRAAEMCHRRHAKQARRRRSEIQTVCSATRLDATVLPNWHEDGPRREFAIIVELPSLLQWHDALELLVQVLKVDQPSDEIYLLVPTRVRRAVPGLAMRMISECMPSLDVSPWEDDLGEPHSSRMFDAFTSAHIALQTISGVGCLAAPLRDHEAVRAVSDGAVGRFDAARGEMAGCPSGFVRDTLLEALDGLADEVEAEQMAAATGSSLAERITDGLAAGEISQDLVALQNARFIAQEWDIDHQAADELLRGLLDGEAGQT